MQVVTRQNAIVGGARRYFTGKPCKHGHVSERMVSNKICLTCSRGRSLDWAANNRPRLAANKKRRHAANPDAARVYSRDHYRRDQRGYMLSAAKQRAKRKGIPFEITIDDIDIPEFCPLLGTRLAVGSGTIQDNSPTLDRIKNDAGYVRGNVAVISYAANRCKGTLTSVDIFKLAENLKAMEEWIAKEKGFI